MRMFPTHVRRSALLGVLPPEAPIGRDFASGGERALDSAFVDCARDSTCRAAVPHPRHDVEMLIEQLRRGPAQTSLWNEQRLSKEPVTLTASAAQEALILEAYQPGSIRAVLPLVHRAVYAGEMQPLIAEFLKLAKSRRSGRAEGLLLSIYCAEDAPRLRGADSAGEAVGTLLDIPTLQSLLAACTVWPRGETSSEFGKRVVSTIPTLLMSGGRDPATPSYLADSVTMGQTNAEKYVDRTPGTRFSTRERAIV